MTRSRRTLFQPRALAVLALGVFLAAAAPALVKLLPDLSGHERYRLTPSDIEVTPPPRWVPADFVRQALERAGLPTGQDSHPDGGQAGKPDLPESLSLLDSRLVETIHAAFARQAWVERVARVRKLPTGRVVVELEYRRPVAIVQVPDGVYAVDLDGTLLPPEDFSVSDIKRLPAIDGIRSVPSGPAGTNWGDLSVTAAARLAEALLRPDESGIAYWEKWGLATIVAPARTKAEITLDDLAFELRTTGGSRILWGRPPGTQHPGELAVEQKIGRLEKYLADFGSFDRPHGPYEIDIRHWREISRRPLVVSQRP